MNQFSPAINNYYALVYTSLNAKCNFRFWLHSHLLNKINAVITKVTLDFLLSVSVTVAERAFNCCCRKGKLKDEIRRLNSVVVRILTGFLVNRHSEFQIMSCT